MAQAPVPGGWRETGAALPAAALRAQTLLRDDRSDVQGMLVQPMPSSMAMEGPGPLRGGVGGRGTLQSLAQRQPVRAPQPPPLGSRPLEPLAWSGAPAAPQRLPRGAGDEGLIAVDPQYCDPPCDAARGGVCAIRSRFAWSAGGSPTCVCSDANGGAGCSVGSPAPGGFLAQGLARVGGVLGIVRVPTEVSIGLHVRDLAAVWLLAAAATVGLFAIATCWLRRPAAKAAALGRAEEWRAPPPETPRPSQEQWVRATTARRPVARSKLQHRAPQVVRDDSDEGELEG